MKQIIKFMHHLSYPFKRVQYVLAMCLILSTACSDYLNIVPDNAPDFNSLFTSRKVAYNALAKMYAYLPTDNRDQSIVLAGDEWVHSTMNDNHNEWLNGIRLMRGLQNASAPLIDYWSGELSAQHLYIPIREADFILEHIDDIPDMNVDEKADWKAQVKFMKAYYYFLLVNQYGPVVVFSKPVLQDAPSQELYQPRQKVDYCFDYIIQLMDEAIPNLKFRVGINELGQIDQVGAKAIKARVMLYRASPFFNGSSPYYNDFKDHDGQPFFPPYDIGKWKDAIDATNEALEACQTAKIQLYHFEGVTYGYDSVSVRLNPDNMQTLYDLRMLLVEPWNKELIWGASNVKNQARVFVATNIMKPNKSEYAGPGPAMNFENCYQQLGASLNSVERFYTNHGLPVNEDLTWDATHQYDIVTTPAENDPAYIPMHGIMQPDVKVVRMYLNREPRFYADLGITGGYWRTQFVRIKTMMMAETDAGRNAKYKDNYFPTAIGVKKMGHPESFSGSLSSQVLFPYPIIRLADLYLMKAEAMNEYYGPSQEVYDAINMIRQRAGIPDVEVSYTNRDWIKPQFINKHTNKESLREIILRERALEFAYENAIYFWDMRRWNRAVTCFNEKMRGWNADGTTPETFFKVTEIKELRIFSERDQLWPISAENLEINLNLIQSPGY